MEEALLHFKYDPHSLPRLQREQLYAEVFYHWCLAVVLKKKKRLFKFWFTVYSKGALPCVGKNGVLILYNGCYGESLQIDVWEMVDS